MSFQVSSFAPFQPFDTNVHMQYYAYYILIVRPMNISTTTVQKDGNVSHSLPIMRSGLLTSQKSTV